MRARTVLGGRRLRTAAGALLLVLALALPGVPFVQEADGTPDGPVATAAADPATGRAEPAPDRQRVRRPVLPRAPFDGAALVRRLVTGLATHPAYALDHAARRGDRAPGARLLITLRVSRI
ncbi:hypothetical protein BTM25_06000 [Actinomadura rubteroloni]|uniref:Uncharacterized protein n=1 Tax=Actinomadura rubteroloni TaxID=1926885 RepID=A0A2P4UMD4_9ACTN|nr:hypothetical protein [Actinomadura rubteroloni]POM26211.1 hypothetical protein BTM25_06000 [Actinomadura rubteroloni]